MIGTFGIRVDIDSVNGRADGAVRLIGSADETLHAGTGNWLSEPTRNKFASQCAAILHPVPDGKSEADVQKDRAETVDRVKALLLRELDQIEKETNHASPQGKAATEPTLATLSLGGDFPFTDTGNGERLMQKHGNHLRFVTRWEKPIHFVGTHWQIDEDGAAYRFAVATMRELKKQAAEMPEEDRHIAVKWFKHATASEGYKKLTAMIAMAAKVKGASVSPDMLDRDPWLFNTRTGTIDLRTGQIRPHRRGDLITKVCQVDYDPAATCPTFMAFLDRIFESNGRLIAFVRRMIGYTLTGCTGERALFILHGSGANGKSTLLGVLRDMLASYATQIPAESLMVKGNSGSIPNDLARLKGARFVSVMESDEGRRLAEGLVKQLTGGEDMITARFMRAEFFDFRMEAKVYLATNHRPEIRGTDPAIWARIKLVPFNVVIPAEERDQTLPAKLKAELPGILAWAVAGCLEWQRDGLGVPAEVTEATENYRGDMDRMGDFIAERCLTGESVHASASSLYEIYKSWCALNTEEPLNQTRFGRKLSDRGYVSGRDSFGRKKWIGLGIMGDDDSLNGS